MSGDTPPPGTDHDRATQLIGELSPQTRARLARRLDDRFHELTCTPRPETARTPCSFPPCDNDGTGEPCDRHEREAAHAEGEHTFCGGECPAELDVVKPPSMPEIRQTIARARDLTGREDTEDFAVEAPGLLAQLVQILDLYVGHEPTLADEAAYVAAEQERMAGIEQRVRDLYGELEQGLTPDVVSRYQMLRRIRAVLDDPGVTP